MAIAGIDPKCYILALFVRDDGVRFLLGDDPYEFKDKQLHFQPNTVANDVVEVQGNDGYLLAGQVRRPGTQSFDGYVCNGTNSKAEVEVKRREFLQFFRRSHFYKVIYVFPNGTAIQRKQGFLVDDPTVQELYQQYPEYHVALNFEDVNYYTYEEDDQGQEIYAKEAIVPLAGGGATGGLIWDEYGVVWEEPWSDLISVSGSELQIDNNAGARAPIQDLELQGDTKQQTYSGKNLFNVNGNWLTNQASYVVDSASQSITVTTLSGSGNKYIRSLVQSSGGVTYTASAEDIQFSNSNQTSFFRVSEYANGSGIPNAIHQVTPTRKSITFTTQPQCDELRIYIYTGVQGGGAGDTATYVKLQLESGSTATSFEPYVGGIPAPNPDYPQEVQTVSGEQTVTVTGKNLAETVNETNSGASYSITSLDGNITITSTSSNNWFDLCSGTRITTWVPTDLSSVPDHHLTPADNGTYTLSLPNFRYSATGSQNSQINIFTNQRRLSVLIPINVTSFQPYTITLEDGEYIKVIGAWTGANNSSVNWSFSLQLEQGSTATAYEPYQSQSYTINLGSIELCKIGEYQDYIYKSGDDWYIYKEVDSFSLATINPWAKASGGRGFYKTSFSANYGFIAQNQLYSNILLYSPTSWTVNGIGINSSGDLWINPGDQTITTSDAFIQWLNSKKAILYGAIATPTDTQITDATLIGQLEALGAMKLFIGENNLRVSATGTNLPATLEFSYPTKFAKIGAEWEEGGTKGATIVDVNAIDNTYPVWELMGPAVNPTISVLTTNTTLTYNGTITASQKLVIDMFNKTATLNGTSVIGNVSGDFVYMAPGTNRIAYTAGNTDAPDSTIYWQEVVG